MIFDHFSDGYACRPMTRTRDLGISDSGFRTRKSQKISDLENPAVRQSGDSVAKKTFPITGRTPLATPSIFPQRLTLFSIASYVLSFKSLLNLLSSLNFPFFFLSPSTYRLLLPYRFFLKISTQAQTLEHGIMFSFL